MKQNYRYEFENNTKYKYAKQEAMEYIISKGYGATITYSELEKIFGLSIADELQFHKLKTAMSHLKNYLINYGVVLKTIVGIGYYILKPKQISGYCYHTYIRKTEKLLNKSDMILHHLDKSVLSEIRIKEYNEVCTLNNDVSTSIEETIYSSDYEHNKEYYNNLDD